MKKLTVKFFFCVFLFCWQQVIFAMPLSISQLQVNKIHGVARFDFVVNKIPQYHTFVLSSPQRLVIDLQHAQMEARINQKTLVGTLVKSIRTGKHENGMLRVVFDLSRSTPYRITTGSDRKNHGMHLVVEIGERSLVVAAVPTAIKASVPVDIPAPTKTSTSVAPSIQTPTPILPTKVPVKEVFVKATPAKIILPVPSDPVQWEAKLIIKSITLQMRQLSVPVKANLIQPVKVLQQLQKEPEKKEVVSQIISPASSLPLPSTSQVIQISKLSSKVQSQNRSTVSNGQLEFKYAMTLAEPNQRKAQCDIVVIIDPGHGGKDPGARGGRGTKEKDVVLAIAKELQRYLNQQNGFSAILTRDGDYYVALRERLRIARANKADMFLSLHADTYKNRFIKGVSVFALSQHGATSEIAKWLAEKENISELDGTKIKTKDFLRSVLINLAQTASIKTSLAIGRTVLLRLGEVTKLHSDSVDQANFVVLQSPDIPSLLIEVGFISDQEDETRLRDQSYQVHFAKAVAQGIIDYFTRRIPV